MRRIYYLSRCSTCKKILSDLGHLEKFEVIDIKTENIDPDTLDMLKDKIGSYDMLFSRRARKYKELDLSNKNLKEREIRKLILSEYTFLKRPIIILDEHIFVGSDNATKARAREKFAAL